MSGSKPCSEDCLCKKHRSHTAEMIARRVRPCGDGCACDKHRPHTDEHRRRNAQGVSASWNEQKRAEQSRRSVTKWNDEEHRRFIAETRRGMNGSQKARGFCYIKGYKYLTGMQDHPLVTNDRGQITEHRVVLYDAIGPGPHPCHWCGKLLDWGGHSGL